MFVNDLADALSIRMFGVIESIVIQLGDRKGNNLVSARELHKVLGINSNFTTWFERILEYGFVEGKDYVEFITKKLENKSGDVDRALQISVGLVSIKGNK